MLAPLTIVALADLVGDLLMVLIAALVFFLIWLTIEALERV
jgi:hypothetical protein